jgi:hypothetical protein
MIHLRCSDWLRPLASGKTDMPNRLFNPEKIVPKLELDLLASHGQSAGSAFHPRQFEYAHP